MQLKVYLDEFKEFEPTASDFEYQSLLGEACRQLDVDDLLHLSMNIPSRSAKNTYFQFVTSKSKSYRRTTSKAIGQTVFDPVENQISTQKAFSSDLRGKLLQFEQIVKINAGSWAEERVGSSVFLFSVHNTNNELGPRSIGEFQVAARILHQHISSIYLQQNIGRLNSQLTGREVVVLQKSGQGKTYRDISDDLKISSRTVRFFLESARHKLGCLNTTHAVATALQRGLI